MRLFIARLTIIIVYYVHSICKQINPLLKRYVQEALETAVPLIRPLWMLDPSDTTCYIVKDEFSIGEEVIVAPILRPGATEREVYLPAGVWKDGIEGSLRKGSRWIHNYKIPLDKIAYFVKMPNNTRFWSIYYIIRTEWFTMVFKSIFPLYT